MTRTSHELSIVVGEQFIDAEWDEVELGWRCFQVAGPLDLGLVGILAGLSSALAAADISIFAISTYDTDYILVRDRHADAATTALEKAGHSVAIQPANAAALRR